MGSHFTKLGDKAYEVTPANEPKGVGITAVASFGSHALAVGAGYAEYLPRIVALDPKGTAPGSAPTPVWSLPGDLIGVVNSEQPAALIAHDKAPSSRGYYSLQYRTLDGKRSQNITVRGELFDYE